MQSKFLPTALLLLLLLLSACTTLPVHEASPPPAPAITELRIMSWNIKKLGRPKLDYDAAVSVLKSGDVIALQEVVPTTGPEALERLSLMLEKAIGERTCEGITDVTDGPGRERYAFIWINSKVAFVHSDGSVTEDCPEPAVAVGLNRTFHERIDREPGQAEFIIKGSNTRFTIANVHLVPTAKKPAKEVPWLFDSVKATKGIVIVVGDMNLGSAHPAFQHARELDFAPALDNVNTSLKAKQRVLNQPYDNIWIRGAKAKTSNVINLFDTFKTIDQKLIYNNISDHSPVTAVVKFEMAD